jgi:hypothetical protein
MDIDIYVIKSEHLKLRNKMLMTTLDLVIGIFFEGGEARLFMLSIGSAPIKSV